MFTWPAIWRCSSLLEPAATTKTSATAILSSPYSSPCSRARPVAFGRPRFFRTRFAGGFRLRFADLHLRLFLVRHAQGAQECGFGAAHGFLVAELINFVWHERCHP